MIAAKPDPITARLPGLPQLAKRINEEHAAAETAMRDGLSHAVEAGKLLIEAKQQCEHGKWLPWISHNCDFKRRTAQGYMWLSKKLLEDGNAQRAAHLSCRQVASEMFEMEWHSLRDERLARHSAPEKNKKCDATVRRVLDDIAAIPKSIPKWTKVLRAGRFSPEAVRFMQRKLTASITALDRFGKKTIPQANEIPYKSHKEPDQVAGWQKVFCDLFKTCNSVRDLGGIEKLMGGWQASDRRQILYEINHIEKIFAKWKTYLSATDDDG